MFIKNKDGLYQSTLLSEKPGIAHGGTTRSIGDMRDMRNRDKVKDVSGPVFLLRQTHSNRIIEITSETPIAPREADAFIYRRKEGVHDSGHPFSLGILTADCVPLFIYDPVNLIIGIVHAGWKGTLDRITENVVKYLIKQGSDPANLLVAMGPFIHPCCYGVLEDRAIKFSSVFPYTGIVDRANGRWSINLGNANAYQLLANGVLRKNIDIAEQCTSCCADDFFSYRKDNGDGFGEMLNFIGMRNA